MNSMTSRAVLRRLLLEVAVVTAIVSMSVAASIAIIL